MKSILFTQWGGSVGGSRVLYHASKTCDKHVCRLSITRKKATKNRFDGPAFRHV